MGKDWSAMSKEERQEARFEKWLSGPGFDFVSPEAKAAYQEKITRLKDAVQLKKTPDRVPVFPFHAFMPVTLFDVLPGEVFYDGDSGTPLCGKSPDSLGNTGYAEGPPGAYRLRIFILNVIPAKAWI